MTEIPKPKKRVVRKSGAVKPIVPALPPENKAKRMEPSLTLYRRIAVGFVLLTCLLLALVVYLSFASATISVATQPQTVSVERSYEIVSEQQDETQVRGQVLSAIVEQGKTFELPNAGGEVVEQKASGLVTIYNTHSADQTLVATTRLLSPEGVLFRIDETMTVPAGGEVTVMVHADSAGKSGEIAPATFTIPGLSEALQKKIYGKSTATFTGGEVTVQVLTQEALDAFALELQEEMTRAAQTELYEQALSPSGAVYAAEVLERKSDTQPGAQTGTVILSLRVRVIGVFFDKEDIWQDMQDVLLDAVPADLELEATSSDLLAFVLESSDLDTGTAKIIARVDATAHLSEMSALLEKSQFAGKSVGDVVEELESYDLISEVNISVTPFWLKRLPSLPDHVKVQVE